MKIMKRRLLSAVVAGMMGAMLVACGSASQPEEVAEITEEAQETPLAAQPTEERPTPDVLNQKRDKAKARISRIETLNEAKQLLLMLCNTNSEWLLDQINR